MSTDTAVEIENSIQELLGERFVHNLSGLIYNRISSLWHIDKECEEHLSAISSRVICALFCLEHLSHIDTLLKKKLKIKNATDRNLTDKRSLKELKERLSREKGLKELSKKILPHLRRLVDSVEAGNLERVTQIAHTGDYLLFSLDDMRSSNHPDYYMWLQSIPYYYERDLHYLSDPSGFKKRGEVSFPEKHIPIEHFGLKEKSGNHINLNTHHSTDEGFFPCTPRGKPKARSCSG